MNGFSPVPLFYFVLQQIKMVCLLYDKDKKKIVRNPLLLQVNRSFDFGIFFDHYTLYSTHLAPRNS